MPVTAMNRTARSESEGISVSTNPKKTVKAKDGSHISASKWKKINSVYVDSEDGKGSGRVYWNAFSPQRVDGTSQSSQSQGSVADNLSQTSPSVVIGAIHNKRPIPAKRQKRSQTFIRHGSKDELIKTYANASINKKPLKKKKTDDSSPVKEESNELTASQSVPPPDDSSSPDFPDDGMDDDLFEASQAFEQEYNPAPAKIRETPKRTSTRSSTRGKLPLEEKPQSSTARLIGSRASNLTTGTSETLSEQFLQFTTSEDSGLASKKNTNSMDGFEDDDDDDIFLSQMPLP